MTARHSFNPDRLAAYPAAEADFVAVLARHQEAIGWDNPGFAEQLMVCTSTWRHTKAGRLPLGFRVLLGGAEMVSHSVYQAAESSLVRRERGKPKTRPA